MLHRKADNAIMKKRAYILPASLAAIILTGCKSSDSGSDRSVSDDPFALVTIDEERAGKEKTLKLSDLTEDFRIIHLENSDDALVKSWRTAVSPGYILIIQPGGRPPKLFTREGRFVADIGRSGNGPGEYSLIYDGIIDEENNAVYLSQFTGPVYRYDMQGNFTGKVDLPVGAKAVLAKDDRGGISAVSLSFSDYDPTPVAASVSGDEVKTAVYAPLSTSMYDGGDRSVGFNGEIFSYRCVDNNVFLNTYVDTMYVYDPEGNRIYPRAAINRPASSDDKEFFLTIELPQGIMMEVFGDNHRYIWYDKSTGDVDHVRFINDYLADNQVAFHRLRDGYYCESVDPAKLMDDIEETWLADPDLDENRKKKLRELLETLDPDDNDIVFLAPLRSPDRK